MSNNSTRLQLLFAMLCMLWMTPAYAQFNDADAFGGGNMEDERNRNDASHIFRNDSTKKENEIPIGLKVWTIDNIFGDRTEAEPDTIPEMFMNSIFTTGLRGEYNSTGNLGAPRIARIFTDREPMGDFFFNDAFDYFIPSLSTLHFTNTLSPITNLTYAECGNKEDGEDLLKARFAVNVNRQLGFGFNINYLYGRGYYQDQSTSHFGGTIYGSYLGDRYNMHVAVRMNHQKIKENGGITNDNYITHPEIFQETYQSNEIPTMLSSNWNRLDNQDILLSQRYMVGFNRKVPMTEDEKKARRFAMQSKIANDTTGTAEPIDTTWVKNEYVPVTSFIHTLDISNNKRNYIAHQTPANYYANTYYENEQGAQFIDDEYGLLKIRNNLAIALLEGFNKWAKAGIKIYGAHEYRRYMQPSADGIPGEAVHENDFFVGGQLSKTQGSAFHFNAGIEYDAIGAMAGDLSINGSADLNFKLLGDSVHLDASAFMTSLQPSAWMYKMHSAHYQWDEELKRQLHTHIEGTLSIDHTNTSFRVAVDYLKDYAYLATTYETAASGIRSNHTAMSKQCGDNIALMTLQLNQNFRLGIINWHNQITYQKSSHQEIIPVPALNIYSNLFLRFKVARVLDVDLGADVRYFTHYTAPEYVPGLCAYAVNDGANKTWIGNYPVVDVYANMFLKKARFFLMMSHVNSKAGEYFFAPHYPLNESVLRFGVSWNFHN